MRAQWTGHISFSLVSIPVKLYGAVDKENAVEFRQLHVADNGPVGYEKKCKKCGETLSNSEIVRGYEYDKDQFVLVTDEELDNLKLASTKTMEIEAFVNADEIDFALFDKPYILGPNGPVAAKTYSLLHQAMADEGRIAIGRVVLYGRERVIALRVAGPGLMAYQLRYPSELLSVADAPLVNTDTTVAPDQLKLAKTLVDTLTRPFDSLELKDRYTDAVAAMVSAKVEGKQVVTVEEVETVESVPDVMSALEASIRRAQESRKPMTRKGEKPEAAAKAGAAESDGKPARTAKRKTG
jgi:DNA end-binding protein Ku